MTELKTLKDFGLMNVQEGMSQGKTIFVPLQEIREEAIKWVKVGGSKAKLEWIKMFFNITEEDLKDGKSD